MFLGETVKEPFHTALCDWFALPDSGLCFTVVGTAGNIVCVHVRVCVCACVTSAICVFIRACVRAMLEIPKQEVLLSCSLYLQPASLWFAPFKGKLTSLQRLYNSDYL